MRQFTKYGITAKFNKLDWKRLRDRFVLKNVETSLDLERMILFNECGLCNRYSHKNRLLSGKTNCQDCPLSVFDKLESKSYSTAGCQHLLDRLFPTLKLNLSKLQWISWEGKDNKAARRQIRAINRMLDEVEKLD